LEQIIHRPPQPEEAAIMWQNNAFGSNGQFPNSFGSQENFPRSPFGVPPGQPSVEQQYFPNQQNMMQYEDTNGDGFTDSDFQPEVGIYNEGAFMQNQFINANPQVCVVELNPFFRSLCNYEGFITVKYFKHSTDLIHYKYLTNMSVPVLSIILQFIYTS
jgi:hypothetical protein